jgi:GNAT superfamily N-acetyltransferase
MGLSAIPPGEIATIVTTLEMTTRPPARPTPDSPLRLVQWTKPSLDAYRTLFRRVGEPWLWFSRLAMDDPKLRAIIHDPNVAIFAAVDRSGIEIGLLELDFRTRSTCEIAYFGLIPELAGQGHGRWLMAHALARGWASAIERVWLHTCTLDHPSALGFYRRLGFVPIGRTIETFADPRLTGLLPVDAAPQVPLLGTTSRR